MNEQSPEKKDGRGRPKKRTLKARGNPSNSGRKPNEEEGPNRNHFLLEDFADLRKRFDWNSKFAEEWFEMMGYTLLNKRDMATALGFHEDWLHAKFKELPHLQNAYERGMAKVKTHAIRALAIEAKCGNVKAIELLLERRFRDEWGKKIEVDDKRPVTFIVPPEFMGAL